MASVASSPVAPLIELLHQMETLIGRLDDIDYEQPAPGRSSGGVGGHVRHCLDHVIALLASTHTGVCAYDRRARGTDIESCRRAALRAISTLTSALSDLGPELLDRTVSVETQIDHSGAMITTRSSIGRELAFVISHTVHHHAIVGQILLARGITLGPRFGLAPATPSEHESLACAR
jgi:hypothetical protein